MFDTSNYVLRLYLYFIVVIHVENVVKAAWNKYTPQW